MRVGCERNTSRAAKHREVISVLRRGGDFGGLGEYADDNRRRIMSSMSRVCSFGNEGLLDDPFAADMLEGETEDGEAAAADDEDVPALARMVLVVGMSGGGLGVVGVDGTGVVTAEAEREVERIPIGAALGAEDAPVSCPAAEVDGTAIAAVAVTLESFSPLKPLSSPAPFSSERRTSLLELLPTTDPSLEPKPPLWRGGASVPFPSSCCLIEEALLEEDEEVFLDVT